MNSQRRTPPSKTLYMNNGGLRASCLFAWLLEPDSSALPGCATPCLFATFRDTGCREKAGGTGRRCPCKTPHEARPLSRRLPSLSRLAVPYRANPATFWRGCVRGAGPADCGPAPTGDRRKGRSDSDASFNWRSIDESNVRDTKATPRGSSPVADHPAVCSMLAESGRIELHGVCRPQCSKLVAVPSAALSLWRKVGELNAQGSSLDALAPRCRRQSA